MRTSGDPRKMHVMRASWIVLTLVAVFAVARKLAQLIYRMLRWGQDYVDVGAQAYEKRFELQRLASLERTAQQFGYKLVAESTQAK